MGIQAQQVSELRTITGASMMKCKEALVKVSGDMEKAKLELKKEGIKTADKKSEKKTGDGIVFSYIHSNNKIGSLVKISCETDFVAKNEELKNFAKDIAMQVVAGNPLFVSSDKIPKEVLAKKEQEEKIILSETAKDKAIIEKIIKGKLEKFKQENCLLQQQFVKNPGITIDELLKEKINKLGENIKIESFCRFEI
jgi:elongation factor Ts